MAIPKKREEHYKLKTLGKSGVFDMGNDIHVEYVQTSLSPDQIKEISTVRSIFKRGELPFDLMMQRELDDDRVKDELITYLIDNELSFFPPITVVILETDKTSSDIPIKKQYPELNINESFSDGTYTFQKRDYGNLFSISILKDDDLQRWYTELTIGANTTLLAVDGQHRLVAFQAILNKLSESEQKIYQHLDDEITKKIHSKDFTNLSIPVTFIFIPQLYEGSSVNLSLVEAFRKIFVDINRNARTVNEMRNILLDEQDLRSIFTRKTCAKIQENQLSFESISIDEVEWEKNSKENQLSNPVAITNVMLIHEMFQSWVGKQDSDGNTGLKNVMGLDIYSKELDINDEFSYDYFDVEYFSYKQKDFVIDLFEKQYAENFVQLINSLPYIVDRHNIVSKIKKAIQDKLEHPTSSQETTLYEKVNDVLFDGEEKNIHLKDKTVKMLADELLVELLSFQRDNHLEIIRTKVFQKAYFQAIFDLLTKRAIPSTNDFSSFCTDIYYISKEAAFYKMWQTVFVSHHSILEKGLRGTRGYSNSASLVESIQSIMYLFFINVFEELNIEIKDSAKNGIVLLKKTILTNCHFKYEKDLQKIYDDEKELETKSDEYQTELSNFLRIFND